jgi:hypothetical protein
VTSTVLMISVFAAWHSGVPTTCVDVYIQDGGAFWCCIGINGMPGMANALILS